VNDRRHDRFPLAVEVEFRTTGAFLVAYSTNLSTGGVFLESDSPLPIGSTLNLKFTVPGSGPIELQGTVAWLRETSDDGKPKGMGIRFAELLDARYGDVIDTMVAEFTGLRVLVLSVATHARTQLARAVRSILSTAEVIEIGDAEAFEAQMREDADLLVMDMDLDQSSDPHALLALRLAKAGTSRPLPVIATARDENQRLRVHELGADEVLTNPPVFADLQAAIIRALAKPTRIEKR
jgi:uncharacterized protein (TIGR02266 family)